MPIDVHTDNLAALKREKKALESLPNAPRQEERLEAVNREIARIESRKSRGGSKENTAA